MALKAEDKNSMFYIPAGPDCRINWNYQRRMQHAFVFGQTPPDFPVNNYEVEYKNRATVSHLPKLA